LASLAGAEAVSVTAMFDKETLPVLVTRKS
jgi:hypothetical protein